LKSKDGLPPCSAALVNSGLPPSPEGKQRSNAPWILPCKPTIAPVSGGLVAVGGVFSTCQVKAGKGRKKFDVSGQ